VKLLYKPFGILTGVAAGMLAGAVFKRTWALVGGEQDKPDAKDKDRTWLAVVAAAALQGAVFGGVKAAVDRAGATGYEALTGVWPGNTESPKQRETE
jgi:hypothetical protein